MSEFTIEIADKAHLCYASQISELIEESAKQRGTGIAKRHPDYITTKIIENKAIICLSPEGVLGGFCYIETWQTNNYVANSGLVVAPQFRQLGLAKKIKKKAFEHSVKTFPNAKLFGLTTSLAVMKINSSLGYQPVTFSELTTDDQFWQGCHSCVNYDILNRTGRKLCLCTGMLYVPPSLKKQADCHVVVEGQSLDKMTQSNPII